MLCVVVMTNQRHNERSEDALQQQDLRSKARRQPRDQDRRVVNPQRRRGDAEATVKTVLYDQRSESRGAEVSGPVLMPVRLTVEPERDKEETRRR